MTPRHRFTKKNLDQTEPKHTYSLCLLSFRRRTRYRLIKRGKYKMNSLKREFIPLSDEYKYSDLFDSRSVVEALCPHQSERNRITYPLLKQTITELSRVSSTTGVLPTYQDDATLNCKVNGDVLTEIKFPDLDDATKDLLSFLANHHVVVQPNSLSELLETRQAGTSLMISTTRPVLLDTSTTSYPLRRLPLTICTPHFTAINSKDMLQLLRYRFSAVCDDLNEACLISSSVPLPLIKGIRSPDYLVCRLLGL